MRKMFEFLGHLWQAAYNLTPEQRKRSVRVAAWIGAVLVLLVIFAAGKAAGAVVPAEHPVWEAVLQSRLVLVRMVISIPLLILGTLAAVALYQVIENTELGKRLLIWAESDDARVEAEKTSNAGTLLGKLLLACILGLALGVLR